jgi:hypothetical protein
MLSRLTRFEVSLLKSARHVIGSFVAACEIDQNPGCLAAEAGKVLYADDPAADP